MVYVNFHKPFFPRDFSMTIIFSLDSFNWNGDPTIISHNLIALKIRLESHIFVLSAAAVATEVAAAGAAAEAAAALPVSDIP